MNMLPNDFSCKTKIKKRFWSSLGDHATLKIRQNTLDIYTGSICSNYIQTFYQTLIFIVCFFVVFLLLSFHRTENRLQILSTARLHCARVSS